MGASKVGIDGLSKAIEDGLKEYTADVADNIKEAVTGVSKGMAKELRRTSPKGYGEYAKGWTAKKIKEDAYRVRYVIHNKKKPYITHLLENGHAKRGGGRVEARPHIAPAYKRATAELMDRIEEAMEEG